MNKPWLAEDYPAELFDAPTLLSDEELRMLAWISANLTAEGDICELGPFLGGSTVPLAWGGAKAGKRVYSYDRFKAPLDIQKRFKVAELCEGSNSLPAFMHSIRHVADNVVPVPGDLMEKGWPSDGPISLLFVDVAKTWALNDHILRVFFPQMSDGAILIQQDFLYHRTPWVIGTMYALRDMFDFLGYVDKGASVIFCPKGRITEADIAPALQENQNVEVLIEATHWAEGLFSDEPQKLKMRMARESIRLAPAAVSEGGFPLRITI